MSQFSSVRAANRVDDLLLHLMKLGLVSEATMRLCWDMYPK